MKLFDKVRPRRTSEEIAAHIRHSLVDGGLKAGDKLPDEAELALRLGVTRGALRDAIRALRVSGVVELRTGRYGGAYISSGQPRVLSENMVDLLHLQGLTIEQLTEARIWIEDLVVRVACSRATEADLQAMEANVEQARALQDDGRLDEKAVVHIGFHNLLAQATQNPLLVIVMHTLTDVMTAFVRTHGADSGRSTFGSRKRFLAAMRSRDAEAAVEEMRSNLRRVHKLYVRLARDRRDGAGAAASAATESPAPARPPARPAKAPRTPAAPAPALSAGRRARTRAAG
jgi:GntR family transcriptional repressor for pyruvate dehydrogenase complex